MTILVLEVSEALELSLSAVDNETNKYKLSISGHSGSLCDSMTGPHNQQFFSTLERDNDKFPENCANKYGVGGGWWNNACYHVCFTADYHNEDERTHIVGITWFCHRGYYYSYKIGEIHLLMEYAP